MQQHVPHNRIRPLSMTCDLLQIAVEQTQDLLRLAEDIVPKQGFREKLSELAHEFDREVREIVDEVQRVLDLVSDACGELAKRGEFFSLYETILRFAEIVE